MLAGGLSRAQSVSGAAELGVQAHAVAPSRLEIQLTPAAAAAAAPMVCSVVATGVQHRMAHLPATTLIDCARQCLGVTSSTHGRPTHTRAYVLIDIAGWASGDVMWICLGCLAGISDNR